MSLDVQFSSAQPAKRGDENTSRQSSRYTMTWSEKCAVTCFRSCVACCVRLRTRLLDCATHARCVLYCLCFLRSNLGWENLPGRTCPVEGVVCPLFLAFSLGKGRTAQSLGRNERLKQFVV
eukprot:3701723-Amphidinium_carterae.1